MNITSTLFRYAFGYCFSTTKKTEDDTPAFVIAPRPFATALEPTTAQLQAAQLGRTLFKRDISPARDTERNKTLRQPATKAKPTRSKPKKTTPSTRTLFIQNRQRTPLKQWVKTQPKTKPNTYRK